MVLTRHQQVAQQGLFIGLAARDAGRALEALRALGSNASNLASLAGATALHWAAAADCVEALQPLVEAGVALEAPLGRQARHAWPPWLWMVWGTLSGEETMALGLPGCTALAVACRCVAV